MYGSVPTSVPPPLNVTYVLLPLPLPVLESHCLSLAWADARGPIRIFDVPQLVAAGEVASVGTLPSFLYFPTDGERESGIVRLPWTSEPDTVVGIFARDHGALVPARP